MSVVNLAPKTNPTELDRALRPLVRMLARQAAREILNSQFKEKDPDHDDKVVGKDPAEAGAATGASW
jgi:hypothetical protein